MDFELNKGEDTCQKPHERLGSSQATRSLTALTSLEPCLMQALSLKTPRSPPPTVKDSPPALPSTELALAKVESGAPPFPMAPLPTPLLSDMESLPSLLSSCPAISTS